MMQFVWRSSGSGSTSLRHCRGNLPARRLRARFSLEPLEDRDLKSNVPGIDFQYGGIVIEAPKPDHNEVRLFVDPADNMVNVVLNGETAKVDAATTWTVNYMGSRGGFDSFTNDTTLTDSVTVFGDHNSVLGGSTWNYVAPQGDFNTIDTRGGPGYVFSGGPNDQVTLPGIRLQYGGIVIEATQAGHNTASVDVRPGGKVQAMLNGSMVEFAAGQAFAVSYYADQQRQGGHDSFTNNTGLTSLVAMYGGYNTVIGGNSWDFVLVTEDHNYVDTRGGGGMVYSLAGPNDQIVPESDVYVYSSSFDPYVYSKVE
jgi:hypothetical protein